MKTIIRILDYRLMLTGMMVFLTISCKKEVAGGTSAITDFDGNVYHSVTIGTQTWMVENLRTTHYRDGQPIPNVADNAAWLNLSTGARCYFNNDSLTFAGTYGVLYNWYAVNSSNICPKGWHIPSDAEWTILISFLGDPSLVGGKIKELGLSHWIAPNTGATNESGFTALPGGYRNEYAVFDYKGNFGYWWNTSVYSAAEALVYYLSYNTSTTSHDYFDKKYGLSVRCLKD
jgi:uncharacterized protein (TIGR02145 family)